MPGCSRIDLAGQRDPGLEDAHLHLCMHGLALGQLSLECYSTLHDTLQAVQAAHASGSGWLRGHGWDHNTWPVPVKPTRHDLDRVAPHRPVALDSKDLHSLWVNTAALELAGLDANTPDIPGGEILRDEQGWPLGILSEKAKQLVEQAIPAPSEQEMLAAARLAVSDAVRLGLTAVHSCEGPESFGALAALDRAGELPLRIWHMLPAAYLDQALDLRLATGYGTERLRIGHIKMFADGALGSGTAEMLAPYKGTEGSFGVAATTTEEIFDTVLRAARVAWLGSARHRGCRKPAGPGHLRTGGPRAPRTTCDSVSSTCSSSPHGSGASEPAE